MKKGEKLLRKKKEEAKKKKRRSKKTIIPTYDRKGRDITPGKKERDRKTAVVLFVISAILLFIYHPILLAKCFGSDIGLSLTRIDAYTFYISFLLFSVNEALKCISAVYPM